MNAYPPPPYPGMDASDAALVAWRQASDRWEAEMDRRIRRGRRVNRLMLVVLVGTWVFDAWWFHHLHLGPGWYVALGVVAGGWTVISLLMQRRRKAQRRYIDQLLALAERKIK